MKNKGVSKLFNLQNIIIGLVVVGVLGIWDPFNIFAAGPIGPGPGPTGTTVPPVDTISCKGGESQSLDLNTADIDNPTTALTEANNIYRECGSLMSMGAWTQGTALTGLQTGGCYEVITGVDETAASCYDNNYGPFVRIDNLPCVMSRNIPVFQDELEGSITATFYNANHDTGKETIVASTPVTVFAKFYTADKEYYGNPYIGEPGYLGVDFNAIKSGVPDVQFIKGQPQGSHRPEFPNTYCLQLNTVDFNVPKWVKAQLQDGSIVEMNRVSVPSVHAAAANHTDTCYEAPIITGDYIEFQIRVDPKAVTAGANDTSSLYAASWYGDTDTGVISWGCENNDAAAIGASNPDTLALQWVT